MKPARKSTDVLLALLEPTMACSPSLLQPQDSDSPQHVSIDLLEQMILALKRAGLLSSHRSLKSCSLFAVQPNDISLKQVIRIGNGSSPLIDCASKMAFQKYSDYSDADHAQHPIHLVMNRVDEAVADTLNHYPFADSAARMRNA